MKTYFTISAVLLILTNVITSSARLPLHCNYLLPCLPHLQNNMLHREGNRKSFPIGLYSHLPSKIFCKYCQKKSIYFIDVENHCCMNKSQLILLCKVSAAFKCNKVFILI